MAAYAVCPMQSVLELPENNVDMPLSEENQNWVLEQIRKALYPNGFRKIADPLRYWGLLGICITVFLSVIAIAVTFGISATNRASQEAEFRGKTDTRLTNIETDVREIKNQLTTQGLVSQANLPLADFKATLPELGASVASARKQNLRIPQKVVDDLARKMTAIDINVPHFWPVAAELISYRSQTLVTPIAGTLPNCTDVSPVVSGSIVISSPTGPPKVNPGIYENCRVTLDSQENSKGIAVIQMHQPSLIFKHCLVVYKGGPVDWIIGWQISDVPADKSQPPSERKIAYTLVFEDCLFDFVIEGIPPAAGQKVIEAVLAQTGNRITLAKS
ncbi:MAG TPA: hypothetical protein VJN89_18465 [Candidatus Acidoferrum sp.]|nr:hypothetical protein [Candidatus Acidoferrum sp.]